MASTGQHPAGLETEGDTTMTSQSSTMTNQLIKRHDRLWTVRFARSLADAEDAIDAAAVGGSVGARRTENGEIVADVVDFVKAYAYAA